jgi:hypothetical protein
VAGAIAQHGHAVQCVGGDPVTGERPFAYTVGLHTRPDREYELALSSPSVLPDGAVAFFRLANDPKNRPGPAAVRSPAMTTTPPVPIGCAGSSTGSQPTDPRVTSMPKEGEHWWIRSSCTRKQPEPA